MTVYLFTLSIISALFSTIILAYISMATMIGPWIAPLIVLFSGFMLRLRYPHMLLTQKKQSIALIQTAGSVGGIVATAAGFSIPTLYFLDSQAFYTLLSTPLSFFCIIGTISIISGGFGIWLARLFAKKLISNEQFTFPVSQLIYETITSQSEKIQSKRMLFGFSLTNLFCFLRDGFTIDKFFSIRAILPAKEFFVWPSMCGHFFHITLMPMVWAIGFIAGINICLPLFIGMLSKYIILQPIFFHAQILPFRLFAEMSMSTFTMAFCSGIVLSEITPLFKNIVLLPSKLWHSYKTNRFIHTWNTIKNNITHETPQKTWLKYIEPFVIISLSIALLSFFHFPLQAQLLIISLTTLATYQISILASKIGLVQLGRFVTLVMIPTLLISNLSSLQITILSLFASICSATATDLLFDYKIGKLCNLSFSKIYQYQWLGLLVTSLFLGVILWLLFTNLELGTVELFGQRGKSRALLIQSIDFDLIVVGLGLLFGLFLKKIRLSPALVFGGILMPNSLTLGFMSGALGTLLSKNKTEQFSFFSGVFAGESIWLIVSIILKML